MLVNYSVVSATNRGQVHSLPAPITFADFCNDYWRMLIEQPPEKPKDDLTKICVGTYADGRRRNANFESATILHADIDTGLTQELLQQLLDQLLNNNYAFLLVQSPSSTPEHLKVRLYLPLTEEVRDLQTYKQGYMHTLQTHFPYITFDGQCIDPARFMYIPNSSKSSTYVYSPAGGHIEFLTPQSAPGGEGSGMRESVLSTPEFDEEKRTPAQIALRDWALSTFNLTLKEHAPHSPFRLDSDSGNYMVHDYGIWDFQDESKVTWEELHKAFSGPNGPDASKIHDHYISAWEAADKPLLDLRIFGPDKTDPYSVPNFVETPGCTSRYHITLDFAGEPQKVNGSEIYELDRTLNEFKTCLAAIADGRINAYWPKEMMGFTDSEGTFQFKNEHSLKALYRATPRSTTMFLGAEREGIYYCPKKYCLYEANHSIKQAKPVFHQKIEEFLEVMAVDTTWIKDYLYHATNCAVAVPWLHMFGESTTGKSFFATLVGSLFTSEPVKAPLTNDGFNRRYGESPVLFMDEQIPDFRTKEKSSINILKELVTARSTDANRKYARELTIDGYHRIVSTQNSRFLKLPLRDQEDLGALIRRVQPIFFGAEQRAFFEPLTMAETGAWVSYQFAEHVAYIRQNHAATPANDTLAVAPYETPFLNHRTLTLTQEQINFYMGLIKYCEDAPHEMAGSNREVIFICTSSFRDWLHRNQHTKNKWSPQGIMEAIKKMAPASKKHRSRVDGERKRTIEIRRNDLNDVQARLYGDEGEES